MEIVSGDAKNAYEIVDVATVTKIYQVGFIRDEIKRISKSFTGGESEHYEDSLNDLKTKAKECLFRSGTSKNIDAISDIEIKSDIKNIHGDVLLFVDAQANLLKLRKKD